MVLEAKSKCPCNPCMLCQSHLQRCPGNLVFQTKHSRIGPRCAGLHFGFLINPSSCDFPCWSSCTLHASDILQKAGDFGLSGPRTCSTIFCFCSCKSPVCRRCACCLVPLQEDVPWVNKNVLFVMERHELRKTGDR